MTKEDFTSEVPVKKWSSNDIEKETLDYAEKHFDAVKLAPVKDLVEIEEKNRKDINNLKNSTDELLSQYPLLKEWFDKRSVWWIETITSLNTYEIFLKNNENDILKLLDVWLTAEKLDEMFAKWNSERLMKLKNWLTYQNIKILSLNYQKKFLWKWDIVGQDQFINKISELAKDKDGVKNAMDLFSSCSLTEIVWELILKEDFRDPKALEQIQYLAWCFVFDDEPFQILVDGKWWPQTWAFFDSLKKNPEFVNSTNWKLYLQKINLIMKWRKTFEWRRGLKQFRRVSDVSKNMQEYAKNPAKYWKNQSVLSRHFEWVSFDSSRSSSSTETISKVESDFINSNRNWKLDWQLGDLFNPEWKSEEDVKIVIERLKSLLPKDILKEHLSNFLKNEKVRNDFSKIFNLPSTVLDDPILIDVIVNDSTWNEKFEKVRIWITSWMRRTAGEKLKSFSGDLQNYIREQCGVSALSVKTKFLEWIFWKGSSIEPVERDVSLKLDDPNYPVYFKDKNCPSTIYEYRPNTGEIYAEDYYNSQGWVLSFWKGGKKNEKPIYIMKSNYSDFIQNISVLNLLPKWRCDSMESLKDFIWENIDSHMSYTADYSATETLKQDNEVKRLKNWIIDTMINIFWLNESGTGLWLELKEDEDWPYYSLMLKLINSVNGASRENLSLLNWFLSELNKNLSDIDNNIENVANPLIKFVLKEYKLLKSCWNDKVKSSDKSQEWRKKDLILWVLMDSLYEEGLWINFEKVKILLEWTNNKKYQELYSSILTEYNSREKDIDVAAVVWEARKEQASLATDVATDAEYLGRVEYVA